MTLKLRGDKNMNLKKKQMISKIVLMLFFNVMLFTSFYALTMESTHVHEMAHKEIAENHGCVDYVINERFDGSGDFECLEYIDLGAGFSEQEQMLHSVNEIVGYNMSGLIAAIVMVCTLLMNTIFLVWLKDE